MGQTQVPPFFSLLLFQFQLILPKSQTSSVSMGMEEGLPSFSIPNICLHKQLCTGSGHLLLLAGAWEEMLCLSGGVRFLAPLWAGPCWVAAAWTLGALGTWLVPSHLADLGSTLLSGCVTHAAEPP